MASLGAASWQAQQTQPRASQTAAQSHTVNRLRFYLRAGFASRMVGGEIQSSNESPTNGFTTLATLKNAKRQQSFKIRVK